MTISNKVKTIDNKIEQNKAKYKLDKQTTNISTMSSGNVSKYEFLTLKDILPEKDLLEKAATIKRFEYLPLRNELKKQNSIAEKQYQKLEKAFEPNKQEEDKIKTKKSRAKSNLVYIKDFSFCKYSKTKEFAVKLSFNSEQNNLKDFKNILELFYNDTEEIKTNSEDQKKRLEKRKVALVTACELYDKPLNIYATQYNKL